MSARVVVAHGADALHVARTRADALDVIVPPVEAAARAFRPVACTEGAIPPHVRRVMLGAIAGAVSRASRLTEPVTVWVVHPDASPGQLRDYAARGWQLVKTG